jgi:O-methyltransferase involved in polyketide biosynthesis
MLPPGDTGAVILPRGSAAISPTAHYTGYVWARNGIADPGFATTEGRALFLAVEPIMLALRAFGRPTFEPILLARHRLIDARLRAAIESGRVSQVVEVAAGLSPRGWRFATEFPALTYVEADLPGMVARKRELLGRIGFAAPGHRVVELDALKDGGPGSLAAVAAELDPGRGLAIVTEGLLNYFDRDAVEGMWRRFAKVLGDFAAGVHLADLLLAGDNSGAIASVLQVALSGFVRGRVHLHYETDAEAIAALERAGFADAHLHRPPESDLVRVVEASP